MRWYRVTLTALDTPATIESLLLVTDGRKMRNLAVVVIYPEEGNNIDATNGPARVGGSDPVDARLHAR
jgi:hypothetical protein